MMEDTLLHSVLPWSWHLMKEGTLPTLDAPAVLVFDTERLFTDAFSENYNPEPRSCFPYLEKVKPRVFLELQ